MNRRLTTAAVLSSIAVACAYVLPLSAEATPATRKAPTAATQTSYTPPPITWSACTNGLQAYGGECGFLVVPLDYAKPTGKKIKIAVSRINHTSDAATYQGALVFNLTSAGGPALGQSAFGKLLPEAISSTYDLIGFDPRGIGASVPALSCDPEYNGYEVAAYTPRTKKQLTTMIKYAENYADKCAATKSDLLGHVTTTDNAQDLDTLRKALGQDQINYYGYWYGAYLGEVYSTMYPTRVRRMILDSSLDPSRIWFDMNVDQNVPLEQNLAAFATWVAKYDSLYHLGSTRAAVKKQYYSVLNTLTAKPDGLVGPLVWTDIFLLVYNTGNWQNLAAAFSAYVNTGDTGPVKTLFEANYPVNNDNAFAMSMATECSEARWPKSWRSWLGATRKSNRKAPFASWINMWFVAPCQSWSGPVRKPAIVNGSKSPSMLMVIDTTLDPNTTYAGSLAVRKLFPKAVLVESGATPAESTTPTSCSPGASIAGYLYNGTLPARVAGNTSDLKCPANALPIPTGAAAKSLPTFGAALASAGSAQR